MQVLLLGPGWEDLDDNPDEALRLLRTMPLLKLMPCGFVVVWCSKWALHALQRWLVALDFRLVENMTWVRSCAEVLLPGPVWCMEDFLNVPAFYLVRQRHRAAAAGASSSACTPPSAHLHLEENRIWLRSWPV